MKAVTVRQPWASLIAAGVKTIETRPRRTSYRGRIAIHAAANLRLFWQVWEKGHRYTYGDEAAIVQALMPFELDPMLGDDILPRGAVVASAVLTDCVQILKVRDDGTWTIMFDRASPAHRPGVVLDQLPFGDFSPGRWALLLDDIKPTTERCPWCWGEGDLLVGREYDGQYATCDICEGASVCDPVPARGQQAVPWGWTP